MATRHRKRGLLAVSAALSALAVAVGATACSSSGGRATQAASTPRLKIAMITHAPAGDAFFDVVRKGAADAAAKDNIDLLYSSDNAAPKQSVLVQSAIDQKVDGIAMTFPSPDALTPVTKKAIAAGIPVVGLNAGDAAWQSTGALMYFGEPEELSGEVAGTELNKAGVQHALCVEQAQGQVQLEARCTGLAKTFHGTAEKIYANGVDMPQFTSTVSAKLQTDKSIDAVVTLNSPHGVAVAQELKTMGSTAKVATFGLGTEVIAPIQGGSILFTVDQQPYLQGYEAIDSLWLYKTNRNILGANQTVATGPYIVNKDNINEIADFAKHGTR